MLKSIGKRKEWKDSGVAEIVGNILILAITVVIFSTLVTFVGMMPTPEKNTYTTFVADFGGYNSTGAPTYLNITPAGGDELEVAYTSVYIYVNNVAHQLDFSKSLTNVSGIWKTGETLSYPLDTSTFTIKPGDTIRIMVIDETRNQVVWSADQIMGLGEGAPIFKAKWVDSDPLTPDIQSVGRGDEFTIYASIVDPDDDLKQDSVYVNLSELGLGTVRMWDNNSDGTFEVVVKSPSSIAYGYYTILFNASDSRGNIATSRYQMSIGGELADFPNLVILPQNIEVSPTNPVRGSASVTVTVRVTNYGKEAAAFTLMVQHNFGAGWRNISSPMEEQHIAGGQSLLLTMPWDAEEVGPSGNHTLRATATVTTLPDDPDYSDNSAITYVTILPKILLVDDDGYNDGSNLDTTRFIGAALQSSNFDYTLHRVLHENGPGFNSGEDKMMDYDIVIWNTGHSTSPLTSTDESNIESFLNSANHGKLWMIGEDIVGNVSSGFLSNYLHAAAASMDSATAGMYCGLSGTFMNGTNFSTAERSGAPASGDIINPVNSGFSLTADSDGNVTSVAYSGSYKEVFFPFGFSFIENPANQTEVAYQVIKWLAGIDFIYGEDLAISQQTISPPNPYYRQDITIKAVVRNNGYTTENTNVEFRITTTSGQITVTTDDFLIPPLTSMEVNTTWEANTVGQVSIVATVDPMNFIKETNELNNQVSSLLSSTSIYVKYRLLLVDDDDSANNNGNNPDTAGYMADALNSLGIDFERNNVTHNSWYNGSTSLTKYNTIIWMTGEATSYTLMNDDIANLTSFLEANGSLWLIGQGIEDDIGSSTFMSQYLGIDGYTLNAGAGPVLYGSAGNNMMHGLQDNITALFTDGTDYLTPASDAEAVLWADRSMNNVVGVSRTSSSGYRTFFMSLDFSFVSGTSVNITSTDGNHTRAEMVYRVLRGFGMPDSRIEIYSTIKDISISDAHPQLGRSYVISAQVRNMGGTPSSALVRFMDGTHQIGSDSIYVRPDETSTAEVVWTPRYAGQRTIFVMIDPIYEVDEIFRFNDNPSKDIYVYFFWDDMENGSSKWQHEATIININGESPIDYLGSYYTTTYTDVIGEWDDSMSVGVNMTDSASHSSPNSYWLQEVSPTGGTTTTQTQTVPLDVVFALDTSGSMDGTKLDNLKQATKNFIGNLTDQDRAAIYTFDGNGHPLLQEDFAYMTTGNKNTFNNTIDGFTANGGTPFYDTLGAAIEKALTYDPDCSDNSRLEIVVGMTDGESNSDNNWSPEADWLVPTSQGGGSSGTGSYLGLLKSPPMVFTIGLLDNGGGWWTPDYHDDNYPTAPDWSHSTHPDPNNYNIEYELWHVADSSLWPWGKYGRDFNKSDIGYSAMPEFNDPDPHIGHYYYTEDSSQLTDIFAQIREIAQSISSGGGTAPPGDVTRASNFNTMSSGSGATRAAPPVLAAYPGDGSTALPSQYVAVVFNKSMDTSVTPTLTQTAGTDPGNWTFEGWFSTHKSDDTAIWSHDNWTFGDSVTMEVSNFKDSSGYTQTTPYSWSFSVMAFTTSGGGGLPPSSNTNKTAVTPVIDLSEASSATLTFWQRYNIVPGANGAFLEIGYKDSEHAGSDGWAWRYIIPSQGSYTGNMNLNYQRTDSFGHSIVWAWNGVSGKGTFSWEFVKVNLLNYVPDGYRSEVRIKFNYTQYGGGTGYGWYLDDVKVAVSRAGDSGANIDSSSADVWQLQGGDAHSGTHSWWNGDPSSGWMRAGIDNSLVSSSIDLTNARYATLSAYFKFNINEESGIPPDGFRVEVTTDNGATWQAINLGARAAWGVSGTDNTGETSYTGHDVGRNWVEAGSLTRLVVDLSDWSGNVVQIRFRVVDTNAGSYNHYKDSSAGFGGFYVDDVMITGETLKT